jgi:hypothetical protein
MMQGSSKAIFPPLAPQSAARPRVRAIALDHVSGFVACRYNRLQSALPVPELLLYAAGLGFVLLCR